MAALPNTPLTFYFGGDLFTHKDLSGNALLAEAIYRASNGRFIAKLPQVLEQRGTSPKAIRDQDLLTLLGCDLALFNYDGTDLDSGTVVEFMYAKFADIPSVILRTDYRSWAADSGHQHKDGVARYPWNLMTSYYPRTEVLVIDTMTLYQKAVKPFQRRDEEEIIGGGHASHAAAAVTGEVGQLIAEAFEKVLAQPPQLHREESPAVYDWLARLPGCGNPTVAGMCARDALARKRERGLL